MKTLHLLNNEVGLVIHAYTNPLVPPEVFLLDFAEILEKDGLSSSSPPRLRVRQWELAPESKESKV
jgi:hypothetical protein